MRLRPFCSQLQDSPTMASGALAPFVRSLNDVDGLYEGAKFVAILGTASRIFTSAKDTAPSMASLLLLPLMAVGSLAVNYPTIPADLTTPVQQRLAVKGPSSMTIAWNTYAKLNSSACVRYGTSSSSLTSQTCSDSQTTYDTSRTYAHDVALTGLQPSTTYYYQIVSTNSTVEHFLSPRTPGDKTAFNMDVVIDLGVYGPDGYTTTKRDTIPSIQPELNHTTIGRLAKTVNDYELVIHPGDFAYADDWYLKPGNLLDGKDAYQAILEGFYEQLQPISGRKAYMASPGNHEAACQEIPYTSGLCPEGQHNFTDFMMRFGQTMPTAFASSSTNSTAQSLASQAQALALPPFWYSFEYGMAHVVMIDTETDFPSAPDQPGGSAHLGGGPFGAPGQQLNFLKADLASVDRSVTPWVIVAGHRPWYSIGGSVCDVCQTAFEPLFYKYGVDLGIFGHVHNSQRFNPVYNQTADPAGLNDPKAPMYIVAGGAGNIEGLSKVGSNYSTNVFAYADDFSFVQIKFMDANHLGVGFVRSETGEVLDRSVLYKQHDVAFVRN
ncbi:Acid phosphatase [Fulvia fulva]|uniref:Purple acid phosphatase n=1 Tax=Passalora fulva TaxID=5499 RepID=A0A9Q8PMR3_PASFU|nr:Acid phosphatase [Fulvia fulva]UJO25237.1 Acid phosphatase [Fulvia fulva]WPV22676.1 Acid phosphatase [Fulvia fulva]